MNEMQLPLPADYRVADMLAYHGRDTASVSERVIGSRLEKVLTLAGGQTLLSLDVGPDAAVARFDRVLEGAESQAAHLTVQRLLGLQSDVEAFAALPAATSLHEARPGLRIPLTATPFEALCWAVIGQQINLAFAAALRREMITLAGTPHGPSGLIAHPDAAAVAAIDPAALTARRFSRSKARYLVEAAAAVAAGAPSLEALAGLEAEAIEAALTTLRGIGPWTARYVLLRGFGHPDIAPIGDSGLATGLQRLHGLVARPSAAEQEAAMQAFAPHRSLATAHLWAGLADQAAGAKSRKPVTEASLPSETTAKSVPPATAAPPAGASSQLKRSLSP